jgi:hypothetical protein
MDYGNAVKKAEVPKRLVTIVKKLPNKQEGKTNIQTHGPIM